MYDGLFSNTRIMENGLNAMWLKNQVISNNLANIDTPNFKASTVDFESVFRDAVNKAGGLNGTRTDQRHIQIGSGSDLTQIKPRMQRSNRIMKLDGNNVDAEFEMAELWQNKAMYDYLNQKLSGAYASLRSAINEGR